MYLKKTNIINNTLMSLEHLNMNVLQELLSNDTLM